MHDVILVDDEVFARKGVRNLIRWEEHGYRIVDEAADGEEALALIDNKNPDLVITDIRMPVLDGLELIHHVSSKGRETKFIIISGYNDFKYAQQAMRYGVKDFILKPVDENELISTLERLRDQLSQQKIMHKTQRYLLGKAVIESLLYGEFDAEDVKNFADQLNISAKSDLYYVVVEANDIQECEKRQRPFTTEQLNEPIKKAFATLIRRDKLPCLYEHQDRIGFILSDDDLPCGVEDFAFSFRRLLEEHTGETMYLYVGKRVKGLANLKESFQTATEALQYKYIHVEKRIVLYDQVKDVPLNYIYTEEALVKTLTEQMEEQNTDGLLQTIDTIFSGFQQKNCAPEAIQAAINGCVSETMKIVKGMDGDEQDFCSLEPLLNAQDVNVSLEELKRLFTEFIMESARLVAVYRKEYCQKGGIKKIKEYIEANYHKNISLKSIASQFYMNPVYLGQMFKKKYGVYFNDFLLQLRIGEAKKLLRQTDMKIYEVAEKAGFRNADYFVMQFKKIERMTPTEYRNKLLKL